MTDSTEDNVDRLVLGACELIAAHSVSVVDVAKDRPNGCSRVPFPFDSQRHAQLLSRCETPKVVGVRRVVATVTRVGENALGWNR